MKPNTVATLDFRFWILDFGLTDLAPLQNPKSNIQHSLVSTRAQSVIEYAVLLAIVIAALVAMQIYIKRGVAGLLANAAGGIGPQFDPKDTTGTGTTTSTDNTTTTARTLNEPDLTDWSKKQCLAEGRPAAECNAICIDLSDPPNGNCDDARIFGEVTQTTLDQPGKSTTDSTITVAPLEQTFGRGDDQCGIRIAECGMNGRPRRSPPHSPFPIPHSTRGVKRYWSWRSSGL